MSLVHPGLLPPPPVPPDQWYSGSVPPTGERPRVVAHPGHGSIAGSATLESTLAVLQADPRCVHVERLAARAPSHASLSRPLPDMVQSLVPPEGLWAHQATAIDHVRDGRSVVIATGTASGKSLAFQIPILEALSDPEISSSSLLLFPTKALAHDQLRSITAHGVETLRAAAYDGDCSPEERTWIRANANVVLTNPEMLHYAILANHKRWAEMLHRLRYVVVDELHVLRGVFGSHVANVLRRLVRLCHHYGSDPTFIFCSATVGEPARLASELCGREVIEITADASPRGPRHVVLWNPAELDRGRSSQIRPSMTAEAVTVAGQLVEAGHRTLLFCRSRRGTELVARRLRERLGSDRADRVRAYRSGYLPEERREIEHGLSTGALDAVVATNALELGIDVGGLDAIVLCGFPGTISSMWQQIGRAGRSLDPSVAVVIAGDDQLDQWIMRHPEETFSRLPERAVTNPSNPVILDAHIASAAYELAVTHDDDALWGEGLDDSVRRGVLDDWLTPRRRRHGQMSVVWSGRGSPSQTIGLRAATGGDVAIRSVEGELVGTVDSSRAPATLHQGAIYLHQGRSWRVTELDLDRRLAVVDHDDGDTYTQARSTGDIRILSTTDTRQIGRSRLSLGSIELTEHVTGYQIKATTDHRVVGRETLDLPPSVLWTTAFWFEFDDALIDDAGIAPAALSGTLHAAEHAAIGILPLFAICDRWDVGGLSTPAHPDTGCPTVIIHEGYPGGVGIAGLGFDAGPRHLAATLGVVDRCGCTGGCPSCVQSPKCGNWNEPLDKNGAARLLRTILHR